MVKGIRESYLDKEGLPISRGTWMWLCDNEKYARVSLTLLQHAEISTIWHGVNDGKGNVFETYVFQPGERLGLVRWVYRTERAAAQGHNKLVAWWWSWHPPKGLEPVV